MKQKRMKQDFFYEKLEKTHTSFVCVATLTLHFKMQGLKGKYVAPEMVQPTHSPCAVLNILNRGKV